MRITSLPSKCVICCLETPSSCSFAYCKMGESLFPISLNIIVHGVIFFKHSGPYPLHSITCSHYDINFIDGVIHFHMNIENLFTQKNQNIRTDPSKEHTIFKDCKCLDVWVFGDHRCYRLLHVQCSLVILAVLTLNTSVIIV